MLYNKCSANNRNIIGTIGVLYNYVHKNKSKKVPGYMKTYKYQIFFLSHLTKHKFLGGLKYFQICTLILTLILKPNLTLTLNLILNPTLTLTLNLLIGS